MIAIFSTVQSLALMAKLLLLLIALRKKPFRAKRVSLIYKKNCKPVVHLERSEGPRAERLNSSNIFSLERQTHHASGLLEKKQTVESHGKEKPRKRFCLNISIIN